MDSLKPESGYGSWWIVAVVAFIAYSYGKKADNEPDGCCDGKPERRRRNNPYHDCRRERHCHSCC